MSNAIKFKLTDEKISKNKLKQITELENIAQEPDFSAFI
jgi:hypothetical protein